MTLPSVIRIFFAIDLPLETKEVLNKYTSALKKESRSHAIRWTKCENFHITLQFLAKVHTEHLVALTANVRKEIHNVCKKMTLSFGSVQLFPNRYRPRVVVLTVSPEEELAMLAALIGHGIQAANYAIESRPFRGHLTLGRIKHTRGVNLNFLSKVQIPEIASIAVEEIVLFQSEPRPEGSEYTVLERMRLLKEDTLALSPSQHQTHG